MWKCGELGCSVKRGRIHKGLKGWRDLTLQSYLQDDHKVKYMFKESVCGGVQCIRQGAQAFIWDTYMSRQPRSVYTWIMENRRPIYSNYRKEHTTCHFTVAGHKGTAALPWQPTSPTSIACTKLHSCMPVLSQLYQPICIYKIWLQIRPHVLWYLLDYITLSIKISQLYITDAVQISGLIGLNFKIHQKAKRGPQAFFRIKTYSFNSCWNVLYCNA